MASYDDEHDDRDGRHGSYHESMGESFVQKTAGIIATLICAMIIGFIMIGCHFLVNNKEGAPPGKKPMLPTPAPPTKSSLLQAGVSL